jgi:hypothetical protein
LAALLIVAGAANAGAESTELRPLYRVNHVGEPDVALREDDDTPRVLAYRPSGRPVWYGRVLGRLASAKPPAYRLAQHVLFRRGGKPSFLAVVWRKSAYGPHIFELYRVEVRSERDVRLRWVRTIEDALLAIVDPSGHDVHGDGVPVLFLEYGSLGSGFDGYGLRVLRLERSSVDVTPDAYGRSEGAGVAGARLRHVLLVSDDRWANLFDGCGMCGPFVTVAMVWQDRRYHPACRSFTAYYDRARSRYERWLAESNRKGMAGYFEYRAGALLNLLQAGRVEEARRHYGETEREALRQLSPTPDDGTFRDAHLATFRSVVAPALDGAAAGAHLPCPLAGFGGQVDRVGWRQRIDYFRFRPSSR